VSISVVPVVIVLLPNEGRFTYADHRIDSTTGQRRRRHSEVSSHRSRQSGRRRSSVLAGASRGLGDNTDSSTIAGTALMDDSANGHTHTASIDRRPSHCCACHFDGHHSPKKDDRSAPHRATDLGLTAICCAIYDSLSLSLYFQIQT